MKTKNIYKNQNKLENAKIVSQGDRRKNSGVMIPLCLPYYLPNDDFCFDYRWGKDERWTREHTQQDADRLMSCEMPRQCARNRRSGR